MNNYNIKEGKLKISENVIETIAKLATLEVDGVDSLANINQGIKGFITKKYLEKPINIEMIDGVANITVSINVKQGISIPELSYKVQQTVKDSIQNMTSITVSKVNIFIAGVSDQKNSSTI
ncbi:MAG: Asp23/Gls24 family envelope stress response protein [Oscillospiraceae bacterium]